MDLSVAAIHILPECLHDRLVDTDGIGEIAILEDRGRTGELGTEEAAISAGRYGPGRN